MKVMIGKYDENDKRMVYLLTKDATARREFASKKKAVEFMKARNLAQGQVLPNEQLMKIYTFIPFKAKEPQPA